MSKVAVNKVSRTITVSAVGKQGVPGPQGDVTPEAVLALAGAETAARLAGKAAEHTALDRIATAANANANDTASDRQLVSDARSAVSEDRTASAASALAAKEAQDRAALDAAATATDRIQTEADRVATAADRLATGADRQQTNVDRASVSASVAGFGADQLNRFALARGIKVRPTLLVEQFPEVPSLIMPTRPSAGTRINAFGNVETMPAGMPRHSFVRTGEYSGLLVEDAATQYLLNNATPATQTVSLPAGYYVLWVEGTGNAILTGGAAGTAIAGTPVTFQMVAAGTVTVTVDGALTRFQLETGPTATSFIPTTNVVTVRAADDWSFPLGNWFNPNEGVIFMEGTFAAGMRLSSNGNGTSNIFSIETGSSNRLLILLAPANAATSAFGARISKTGGDQLSPGNVQVQQDRFRVALRYGVGAGLGRLSANGVLGTAVSPSGLPVGMTAVNAKAASVTKRFTGAIERFGYIPRAISDAELASLTAL